MIILKQFKTRFVVYDKCKQIWIQQKAAYAHSCVSRLYQWDTWHRFSTARHRISMRYRLQHLSRYLIIKTGVALLLMLGFSLDRNSNGKSVGYLNRQFLIGQIKAMTILVELFYDRLISRITCHHVLIDWWLTLTTLLITNIEWPFREWFYNQ